MNFRYRIEFYPLIELGAFLGFLLLCILPRAGSSLRRVCTLAGVSLALGIVGSHVVMILYKVSDFGPAIDMLRYMVFAHYLDRLKSFFAVSASWIQ